MMTYNRCVGHCELSSSSLEPLTVYVLQELFQFKIRSSKYVLLFVLFIEPPPNISLRVIDGEARTFSFADFFFKIKSKLGYIRMET